MFRCSMNDTSLHSSTYNHTMSTWLNIAIMKSTFMYNFKFHHNITQLLFVKEGNWKKHQS